MQWFDMWDSVTNSYSHYEKTPIQIYWKFYNQKKKISDKNSDIF